MRGMSETESTGVRPAARHDRAVRVVGIIVAVLGIVFLVAGVATYAIVSSTLADEKITVSDDADRFAGQDVTGPFTAYAQADVIAKHAEEIGGGKTYAEIPSDDPARDKVMTADFLQASLYTSVVAFGVCALIIALGIMFFFVGLTFRSLDERTASLVAASGGVAAQPAAA